MDDEAGCELCEAAPLTERFHDDELCWIAECESCFVPMVVWKVHDAHPSDVIRAALHDRLTRVVGAHFEGDIWIDDHLRSIPTHYHAHARPRGGVLGSALRRRSAPLTIVPPMTVPSEPQPPEAAP